MHPLIYCDFPYHWDHIWGSYPSSKNINGRGNHTIFRHIHQIVIPKITILMGGIEPSLRFMALCFPHYCCWLLVIYNIYITHYTPMIVDFIPSLSTDIYIYINTYLHIYIYYIHIDMSSLSIDIIPWRSIKIRFSDYIPLYSHDSSSHTGFIFGIIHLSYDECSYHWNRIINPYYYLVGGLDFFPIYWECHHPNWRSHIFQRGRYTNHLWYSYY